MSANDSSQLHECAVAIDAVAGAFAGIWASPHVAPHVPVPATQLRVLFIVKEHGGINLSRLAGELGSLLSSASRLCDRLEAAGLIVRDPAEQSRREITIRLTPDGDTLLDQVRLSRQAELMRILTEMPEAARSALLTGLTAFHHATGRPAADTSDSFPMPA